MDEKPQVTGLAVKPTLQIEDFGLKAVANMVKLPLEAAPDGEAHGDLASDLFLSMYTDEVSPLAGPVDGRELNQALMQWVRDNGDFENTRKNTQFNMPAAMFTAGMMWLQLSRDDVISEALKKQEQASDQCKEADTLDAMAEAMQRVAEESGLDDDWQAHSDMESKADAARTQAEQSAGEAVAQFKDDAQGNAFKNAGISSAMIDAAETTEQFAKAAAGWGMGPGDDIYQDPTAALKFIEANQGKLAKLAILAGRLKGFVLQGRSERQPVGVVPTDVDLTRHLPNLLPGQMTRLAPQMPGPERFDAVNQLSSQGLLGYTTTSDKEEDGSAVCATDVSPSMRGPRELVAKAISLAIGFVKKKDGKPYFLFNFASDPKTMKCVRHTDDLDAHFEWAKHLSRGGTDFDMALREAMRLLSELPDGGKNADLVFNSDGEAGVSQEVIYEWLDFQEKTGARLFYVPVGKSYYPDMEILADRVYHLTELSEETGVDLALEVGRWLR